MTDLLPEDHKNATLVGRVWHPDRAGPAIVRIDGDDVVDITSREIPTMRDLLETEDPTATARRARGEVIASVKSLVADSTPDATPDGLRLLSPADLQAIKASGVTFAGSMIERVIEEKADGNPDFAAAIREKCQRILGDSLRNVEPGSEKAAEVKSVLQGEGLWSQYLEVGIGADAEVFTKCQPMASVGWGAAVGLHPMSVWNNPEPEVVLAIDSRGRILGATLGNDVNLRDVEGRSALLLGKAKDNNASAAIGPFLRLFDKDFGLEDVRSADLDLTVEGPDGFTLNGHSTMREISRDPASIVAQTIGGHHQYPDGFFLYLGTLFAPTEDRDGEGQGFTHKVGDIVTIESARLGKLQNTVRLCPDCPPWTFGTTALMRNLAGRGLI